MTQLAPVRRALISVSDKTDLVPFAKALRDIGVEIISTGGTAEALRGAGIEVISIDQVTGFPEMMGGRVKTLHPAIHGALLGRRDVPDHMQAMREHNITPIDLVCVNLYPFEKTILEDGITEAEAIEQIDIGGPSMLRSAAKNYQFVTVVTSPEQYDHIANELREHNGATTLELRRELAAAAFTRTAQYDTAISAWMSTVRPGVFPDMLRLSYALKSELRYGENPHQRAAVYVDPTSPEPSVVNAELVHGKPLSYNNVNDAAAALELVQELSAISPGKAAAAIIKHANPCGAAVADEAAMAFQRAYAGDSLAAYGGILAISAVIDGATAEAICDGQKFLEVIVAPGFDDDARSVLSDRWKNVRLLAVGSLTRTNRRFIEYRTVPGGVLAQQRDMMLPEVHQWRHAAGPEPDDRLIADAAFLWVVTKHLKSNAVAIGSDGQLLGGGMGQVDRVTACKLAVDRAFGSRSVQELPYPAIAASDAFFPFPDGPQLLIDAGVKCIVHPGGSVRDQETIDLCQSRGVTCILTGARHFRH